MFPATAAGVHALQIFANNDVCTDEGVHVVPLPRFNPWQRRPCSATSIQPMAAPPVAPQLVCQHHATKLACLQLTRQSIGRPAMQHAEVQSRLHILEKVFSSTFGSRWPVRLLSTVAGLASQWHEQTRLKPGFTLQESIRRVAPFRASEWDG